MSELICAGLRWQLSVWRLGAPSSQPFATLQLQCKLGNKPILMPTVRHTAISHDCRYVAGCCDDGSICLWNLPSSSTSS